MTGNENWDFLYAYMYLRFWPSNVPMISDLNINKFFYTVYVKSNSKNNRFSSPPYVVKIDIS